MTGIPFTGNPLGFRDSVRSRLAAPPRVAARRRSGTSTLPTNTEGGPVKGFEISYQQPFTFLPGVWSNFGTILNYTDVESEINYMNVALGATPHVESDDLAGLSKDAYNATLYFDNKVFSARVSAAYRSDYLTTGAGSRRQRRRRHGRDAEHRLLGLVQHQRQLLRLARGAEPHR